MSHTIMSRVEHQAKEKSRARDIAHRTSISQKKTKRKALVGYTQWHIGAE